MQRRSNGRINFNFTEEQQERFSLLYAETKKEHPELTDDVMGEKTKVILAHYVINEAKYDDKDIWKEFTEVMTEPDEI
jgi:hypothetical protein